MPLPMSADATVKKDFLPLLGCPRCEAALGAAPAEAELVCAGCSSRYPITNGVPCLLDDAGLAESATSALYSDIWTGYANPRGDDRGYRAPAKSHLQLLELAAGRELVQGDVGIDAGCGPGHSTLDIGSRYPGIRFVGIDLAEGVVRTGAPGDRPNVQLVRGNLLHPPLARERFDFAFSFGVLHHTPDPERAFVRLLERLKPGGRVTIFLYKDFSDIPLKRAALRAVNALRRLTLRLKPATLRRLAWLFAPVVYVLLTLPARALSALGLERFARHMPYGTFPHLTAIASSLEDRFGAPYEHRFSQADLERWIERTHLADARVVDCLSFGFSGLVLTGTKRAHAGPEKG